MAEKQGEKKIKFWAVCDDVFPRIGVRAIVFFPLKGALAMSSLMMHLVYEMCDVKFRTVDAYEDIRVVRTPEGFRLEYPPPYNRYSDVFATRAEALWVAERFCAVRLRHNALSARRQGAL